MTSLDWVQWDFVRKNKVDDENLVNGKQQVCVLAGEFKIIVLVAEIIIDTPYLRFE